MPGKITFGAHLAKIKTSRAAVIPYVVMKNSEGKNIIYYLLARDYKSGDITDFGGGVKQNEVSLTASMREFKEESNEIFGTLYDKINNSATYIALIDKSMSVLFIPLSNNWYYTAQEKFNQCNLLQSDKKKSHNEVSELIWFDEKEFENLLSPDNTKMWTRVKKFYYQNYQNYGDQLSFALKEVYCY